MWTMTFLRFVMSTTLSVAHRHPILSRVTPSCETPLQSHDRLRAAERDRGLLDENVSHRAECRAHSIADRRLERHALTGVVAEARRVDRGLHIHAEDEVIEQELHVSLRLHTAAHQPEAHVRLVATSVHGAGDEAWDERVERPFSGGDGIGQTGRERESRAAVVQREARSEEHTSELQSQSNLVCRLLLEKKKAKRSTRFVLCFF